MINRLRPVCSLDIEGTGRDSFADRIVQIAVTKFLPELPLLAEPESTVQRGWLVNPGRTMTDEVIAVHGITNERVADYPPFSSIAEEVHAFIAGCDLIGFNLLNYDVPMLWEEFYRTQIEWDLQDVQIIDVGNIFKKKEERSLSAAVQFYLQREHKNAHSAQADADATAEVLEAQLKRYPDLGAMIFEELVEYSHMEKRLDLAGKIIEGPDGRPTYTLKRVRGVAVEDDPGFAYWMLERDFPANTRLVLRRILESLEQY